MLKEWEKHLRWPDSGARHGDRNLLVAGSGYNQVGTGRAACPT